MIYFVQNISPKQYYVYEIYRFFRRIKSRDTINFCRLLIEANAKMAMDKRELVL